MKNLLKKLTLFAISAVFLATLAGTVFAGNSDVPYDLNLITDKSYWRFWEYQGTGYSSADNIERVNGYDVHRQCTRLSGLSSSQCKVNIVGTTACKTVEIICNARGVGINRSDSWEPYGTPPNTEYRYLGVETVNNPQPNDSKADNLEDEEKAGYCDLTRNYCPGYEDPGNSDYALGQDTQAWDALQSGDLSGFLCHSLDADTEGFFGCEDGGGEGQTFVLPVEETTFTKFGGDFEAPETTGYSPGLTENKGIREFVLNVINFALGFLGLIAVVAIIYGGFIYLTAGGDDSKTEKGKNSVVFAVIGIILVLASYAIVRTVICFAPVGGDDQASFCRVSGGGSVAVNKEIELAEEVGASVTTTYESAHDRLREIGEGAIAVSTSYLNTTSAADYLPTIEYALQGGLDEGVRVLSTLQRTAQDFPRTMSNINTMMDYLSRQRPITKAAVQIAKALYTNMLVMQVNLTPPVNPMTTFENAYEFMDYYSAELKTSAEGDYEENIDKYILYAEGLENLFTDMSGTTITGKRGVKDEMTDVKDKLVLLRTQKADRALLTDLIKEINQAAEAVKNLEFVKVKLNSSVRTCTAPCIALFDSIGSIDPSGQSIFDENHHWDLNGDGNPDQASSTCNEENKATVSCIYNNPGTYVVTLTINSAQPEIYASGLAITRIEVRRPLAQVKVNVSSTDGVNVLAMDNTVTPAVRNGRVKFTLEEAKAGLTFNAGGSKGSSGRDITEFVWSFGAEQFAGSNASKNYSFDKEGSYKVILEVIENNLSERSVISLEVGSPSSNFVIQNNPNGVFQTGQTVSFDGGYSKSDNGAITDYTWRITRDGATVGENTSATSTWSFVPDAPGQYIVSLQITDALGEGDINERTFLVESQTPTACFTYSFEDDAQPGTARIRNCSTDPDENDVLAYDWTVINGEFTEGTDATSEDPVIKFNKKGKQTITLSVNDQYLDDNLRKEDTVEKQVQVESVLDIALDIMGGAAYQLDEKTGLADVEFKLDSENAVEFEIDYGDGSPTDNSTVLDTANFTHSYSEAGAYKINATVFDSDNDGNSITRRVFVGDSESPLPVLDINIDGVPVDTASGDTVEIPRKTSITFDGSDSLNRDGTGRRLLYLVNYGDGKVGSNKLTSHVYEDIGTYEVTFTATDEATGEFGKIELTLEATDTEPIIHSLSSSITSGSLETPVKISVSADAEDLDGRIVQYTWSMFDADNTSNVLDASTSEGPLKEFIFHGLGTTGEEHRVGICIKVKDDGDNITDSCVDGPYTYVVAITGQNEPPRAKFSVADNSVQVGDPVTFYDESTDDSEVVGVQYDVLGDGFTDDDVVETHSFSYTYEKVGTYQVRIKAIDINGAVSVTRPTPVTVTSSVDAPIAKIAYEADNLEVSFTDNSEVDPGTTLDERAWDFDLDTDSDGDGIDDNDIDSTEDNPVHTYDKSGNYRVKLTIKDAQGNEDSVQITVAAESEPLKAVLNLTPAPDGLGIVHLQGQTAEVRADVKQSTGPIVRYVIEQNIGFDANYDYEDRRQGLFVYDRSWRQPFTMRLTVYDENGKTSKVSKKIVFDPLPAAPKN
ncbi:MAG: PKD domain-containing protein [Candidatus Gracilibacteria bacterium]|nr:PKD domain-containing protein [Candidatus Gracilibacteria bacterium]